MMMTQHITSSRLQAGQHMQTAIMQQVTTSNCNMHSITLAVCMAM
jgi:hypothetical protein